MLPFNQYLKRIDQRFWINNYIASFIIFMLNNFDHSSSFILYPVSILLLLYILEEKNSTRTDTSFLGFYPLQKGFTKLAVVAILNYVLWYVSGLVFLVALTYVLWKEYH